MKKDFLKSLILYSSKNGSTKKLAFSIKDELDCKIYEISLNNKSTLLKEIQEAKIVILGFFIEKGFINEIALNLARDIKNANLSVFITCGMPRNSSKSDEYLKNSCEFLARNNKILSSYISHGAISKEQIKSQILNAKMQGRQIEEERFKRWEESQSHPNKEEIQGCKDAILKFNF